MGRINKDNNNALQALVRPGSLDVEGQQVELFPFDAFSFDQYDNKVGAPLITLKKPWRIDVETIQDHTTDFKSLSTGSKFTHIDGGTSGDIDERYFDGGDNAAFSYHNTVYNDTMGSDWDGDENERNYLVLESGLMVQGGIKVKDGFIRSANYEAGSTGTFIDMATGNVEFNDGTFRGSLDAASGTFSGDLTIGSDEDNRQIDIGSKGILAKDSNGVTIHDLPDAAIQSGNFYTGHILWFQDQSTYQLIDSTGFTKDTWTELSCITGNNTNIRGGVFKVYLNSDNGNSGVIEPFNYVWLRPKGSSWSTGADVNTPEGRLYFEDRNGGQDSTASVYFLICPIGDNNKIEFNADASPDNNYRRIVINQLGVLV